MTHRKRSLLGENSSHDDEPSTKSRKCRLHLQNQERAYIAASRRTDRSVEARYQSALLASEVHKKRTGKGLRITHGVVENEDMYEEEDQGVPESWGLPPHRTERRAMSQTDAYVAALIARKSGMGNFFQTNNGFFSTRFSNYMNDGGNTSRSQSNYTPLAVDDYRRQPVQDAKAEELFNTLDYSPLSKRGHTLYLPAECESSVDCSSLASPTFPAASSQIQPPSPTSSSSDMLTYDSNHAIDFNSESGKQSLGMLSLNLEEFLVDMESDSSLNLTQDGMLVRYG